MFFPQNKLKGCIINLIFQQVQLQYTLCSTSLYFGLYNICVFFIHLSIIIFLIIFICLILLFFLFKLIFIAVCCSPDLQLLLNYLFSGFLCVFSLFKFKVKFWQLVIEILSSYRNPRASAQGALYSRAQVDAKSVGLPFSAYFWEFHGIYWLNLLAAINLGGE